MWGWRAVVRAVTELVLEAPLIRSTMYGVQRDKPADSRSNG